MKKETDKVWIKSITLKNAACFEDITIDFNDRINVLIGLNGSGKTTVLNSLFGIWFSYSFSNLEKIVVNSDVFLSMISRILPSIKNENSPKFKELEEEINIQVKSSTFISSFKAQKSLKTNSAFLNLPSDKKNLVIEQMKKIPFIPISCYRTIKNSFIQGPKKLDESNIYSLKYLDILIDNYRILSLNDFKQWIVNHDYGRAKDNQSSKKLLDYFEKKINKLFPSGQFIKYKDINLDSYEPIFLTKTGKTTVKDLPSGFKSILAIFWYIIFNILKYHPEDTNPFDKPAIVLIDELDAHLHPEWQKVILESLRKVFPKIQFIVTTQSPIIVSGCKKGEVKYLTFDDENNRVILDEYAPENPAGWEYDELLSKAFGLDSSRGERWASDLEKFKDIIAKSPQKGINRKDSKFIKGLLNKLDLPETDPLYELLSIESLEEMEK